MTEIHNRCDECEAFGVVCPQKPKREDYESENQYLIDLECGVWNCKNAIKLLVKENERLKKDSEENQDLATIAYMQGASRNKAELDKAKEIIKKYNDVAEKILTYKKRDIEKISKIKKCAESFLEGERNCTFRTSKGELNNGSGTVHKIEYRA